MTGRLVSPSCHPAIRRMAGGACVGPLDSLHGFRRADASWSLLAVRASDLDQFGRHFVFYVPRRRGGLGCDVGATHQDSYRSQQIL